MSYQLILLDIFSFIYKQAYACIFGGFLLGMIIITRYYYPLGAVLYRYDFLFFWAVIFQIILIVTKLESWKEAGVIALFHIVAMGMELFKTDPSIGSWSYPEPFTIGILSVPFFVGFMYSAVGSYIARVWRIFGFEFSHYPKKIYTIILAVAIYTNFFTHHFMVDLRYIILACVLILFWRTRIYFKPRQSYYSMNLAFGFFLVSLFIWIAENIATYSKVWIYPSQAQSWHMVWGEKILAWFLLMIISFVLVSLIQSPENYRWEHSK